MKKLGLLVFDYKKMHLASDYKKIYLGFDYKKKKKKEKK